MKQSVVLLLLACTCVHGAPTGHSTSGSCGDAAANVAAAQAMDKINAERSEGYIFSLERLSNVHQTRHGEHGVVFYLTIDVFETKCHVLSRKNWRNCDVRSIGEHPVYGQCRAVIYINRVHRVSRLYKYSCAVRPAPASKIAMTCPDCPTLISLDTEQVQKTMQMGLEKFNNESGNANYFLPLNITRATSQWVVGPSYFVDFTIQESVCSNKTDLAEVSKCDPMPCEFAHKGLCKASYVRAPDKEYLRVDCEIFEPEAAEEEKKRHLLGGELDHSHKNVADLSLGHDHTHDHTHIHSNSHTHDHNHTQDQGHHHTHEHSKDQGQAHGHSHSHDHSHDHDHAHTHHSRAHDHTEDQGHHSHHNYGHGEGDTHEHDHELALDHEHKHEHLHEHEHHHHHHEHKHEAAAKKPEGVIYILPSVDKPMTLPSHPDQPVKDPAKPSTLPFHPDPQIPGEREPTLQPFPTTLTKGCPAEFKTENNFMKELFAEDPLFKTAADCEKPVMQYSMFAQCS
ncbi:fetuin B [Hoplias malabaricus]|uniref:fetuin B n=1 Tax=Hoplias malabaricus TaxID=27720 RepID=UPI00346249BF